MKKSCCLVCCILILFSFFSCGENKNVVIDVATLSSEIANTFDGGGIELVEIDDETVDIHYGLKGMYSDAYCLVSITVTSDELLIIEATDEATAEKAYALLDEYVNERIELFTSYAPEQVSKLESAMLQRAGKYVILLVAEDTAEAEKIWKKHRG